MGGAKWRQPRLFAAFDPPDDFKLSGTFAQKAERIGRMVPPLMTKAIAESIYTNILEKAG
jgi:DNA (cytosine-5)-methyltransferase 1